MEKETNIFNININTELPIEELNYIHKILLCLENTYKSPDKEIRKKSEEFLKEVEQNLFSHLIQIFNFIKKNTISKELNNAFIIFIRNSIINKKNSNLLSKENYIELIMLIINIIVDPEYPSQCLREMNKIFEEIIDNKEFIKDKTFMKNFINLFASKLKIGLIQVHSYKSIAYIFENILGSNCIDESNCQYFVDIVLNCTEEMLNKIINILGEIDINKIGNNNIEIQNNIQYYLETVKIIYELVLLISIMTQNQFNNFDKFSDKLMNYFFDTGIKMLTINYTQLYEAIMKMKTKILRYINSIVLNIPLKITSKDKKMIDQHKNLITFCIESLKSQNFFIFNNDNSAQKSLIEKFDIQIIIYLYKMVFDSAFSKDLSKYLSNITYGIVFPLLISSEEEINNLENDPYGNNYANFIYDLVNKKSLKQLKTTLSKFISIGCKNNEKYLQFLICYTIDIIQLCIGIVQDKILEPSLINQNDAFVFNQKINEVNKVEVSFLVLCIIYKIVSKKGNKVNYYKVIFTFIQNNLKKVMEKFIKNSIVKQRICLFLSIYIKDFIETNIDLNLFKDICEFLFFNIFNEKEHIAQYESFEAITKILTNKNFKNEITSYLSKKYYEQILSFAQTCSNPVFFDMLSEIVYSVDDLDNLQDLLENLLVRIKKEILGVAPRRISTSNYSEMMQQEKTITKTDYRLIISKCFSVLHKIFKNEKLILTKYNEIEKFIEPLMKYMKTPNKIDFDDDLIDIIIKIIKTLKYLPNIAINLLPDLGQVMRKNKGITKNFFTLINLYIIYNNKETENNEEYSKCLFKLYKKSFTNTFSKDSPYLCTILMQIWILFCTAIPKNIILNIISFARERFQDINLAEKKGLTDTSKVGFDIHLINLSIINLLLSAFINYSAFISDIINIKELIQYASYIVSYKNQLTIYENKFYVLSLCSIMRNKNLRINILDDIPKIISYCCIILKRIKKRENNIDENIISKNSKDSINDDINDDDNEEMDQDKIKSNKLKNKKLKSLYNLEVNEKTSLTENRENSINNNNFYVKNYNQKEINNIILFPNIQKGNEIINVFKNTLELLKTENNEQFSLYINNLSKEEQKHLQEIIESIDT